MFDFCIFSNGSNPPTRYDLLHATIDDFQKSKYLFNEFFSNKKKKTNNTDNHNNYDNQQNKQNQQRDQPQEEEEEEEEVQMMS